MGMSSNMGKMKDLEELDVDVGGTNLVGGDTLPQGPDLTEDEVVDFLRSGIMRRNPVPKVAGVGEVIVRRDALACAVESLAADLAEYDMLWAGRPVRLARRDDDRAALDELKMCCGVVGERRAGETEGASRTTNGPSSASRIGILPMKMFPILNDPRNKNPRLTQIPWAMLEPHEAWAKSNHGGQSLTRLAERGGLGEDEVLCVLSQEHIGMGRLEVCRKLAAEGELVHRVEAWTRAAEERATKEVSVSCND